MSAALEIQPVSKNWYTVECFENYYRLPILGTPIMRRRKPKLKWAERYKNIVVTQGLNQILAATAVNGFRVIDPPTTPTINVTGGGSTGGSLQAGTYYLKYSFVTAAWNSSSAANTSETNVSAESAQFTVSAGNKPRVTLPALPPGAVSMNIYLTAAGGASGSETLYASGVTGTTYDLTAAQSAGRAMPTTNSAFMTPAWFVGLKGSGSVVASDTAASHGGWSELTPYSNATRPQWTPGTISGGSVDNSAAKAVFNINATSTVYGCFLISGNVPGDVLGILYGGGDFSASRSVANGDTLNVTVTLTQS